MKKREIFKMEGDKITRLRRNCPKGGDGVFLADHKNRLSCGKCGYTEFKGKQEKKTIDITPKDQTIDESLNQSDKTTESNEKQPDLSVDKIETEKTD